MRPASISILTAATATFLLAACHMEDYSTDPLHAVSDSSYVDNDLGYSLSIPPGWFVRLQPRMTPGDFSAEKIHDRSQTIDPAYAGVSGSHSRFSASDLRQSLETYYDTASSIDSFLVSPTQVRSGVEIVPIKVWSTYGMSRYISRQLFFVRKSQRVVLTFSSAPALLDSHPDLMFIDSSLTFF